MNPSSFPVTANRPVTNGSGATLLPPAADDDWYSVLRSLEEIHERLARCIKVIESPMVMKRSSPTVQQRDPPPLVAHPPSPPLLTITQPQLSPPPPSSITDLSLPVETQPPPSAVPDLFVAVHPPPSTGPDPDLLHPPSPSSDLQPSSSVELESPTFVVQQSEEVRPSSLKSSPSSPKSLPYPPLVSAVAVVAVHQEEVGTLAAAAQTLAAWAQVEGGKWAQQMGLEAQAHHLKPEPNFSIILYPLEGSVEKESPMAALGNPNNIFWQESPIGKAERQKILNQKGCVVWITGLSGSGKSTLACSVSREVYSRGKLSYVLDGDNLRHGLTKDLGFSADDRTENIRRVGEVAKLFADAGLICIASLISPYRKDRDACRAMLPDQNFIEVFMNMPLTLCESRDAKGLYKLARAGKIKGFTGIDDPYERPLNCEIELRDEDGTCPSPADMAAQVVSYLQERGYLLGQ